MVIIIFIHFIPIVTNPSISNKNPYDVTRKLNDKAIFIVIDVLKQACIIISISSFQKHEGFLYQYRQYLS